jgi:biopolymer transport protein ExbD
MTRYYLDIDDELAAKLKQVNEQDIIEVLNKLAEKESSADELAAYDSVSEIMADSTLSEAEKKRLKLKAERRSDICKR